MKKYLVLLLVAGCATTETNTQPEETAATPAPAPAPAEPPKPAEPPDIAPATDGDVTYARVSGIDVLVKRIPKAEIVALNLYIKGGVRNWDANTAGVESLALDVAANGGAGALDKDAFTMKLTKMGSAIDVSTGQDHSAVVMKSLLANFDETFEMLADVYLKPAMPASEIEVQRSQALSHLRHELESPDGRLSLLAHKTLFKGHPYENRAIGTMETVKKFKADDLTKQLDKLRERKRLLVIAVGDVDPAHVIERVKARLGGMPLGTYEHTPLPPLKFEKANLITEELKLPTNYIVGNFIAPKWGDPEMPTAMVTMSLLQYREFEEVRTKRNLSYAPNAFFSAENAIARGGLYVTAVDPNTTFKVMLAEAARLQNEAPPEKDVLGTKSQLLSGFWSRNETTDGQASLLARAQLIGGDWKLAREIPERVKAVTPADVQAFAKKYIKNLQVTVVGDPKQVDSAIFGAM